MVFILAWENYLRQAIGATTKDRRCKKNGSIHLVCSTVCCKKWSCCPFSMRWSTISQADYRLAVRAVERIKEIGGVKNGSIYMVCSSMCRKKWR
ncbi:MAG: hypothetical protein AYK19_03650 [Theionarchaea archaeon DG-70-1]|nr:MAG: hypothetical protein AYK19_03650 [Theionarchaea archaeon DG-70-1]